MKNSLLLLSIVTLLITGCNTVSGVGRDIERGGEAIQKASQK